MKARVWGLAGIILSMLLPVDGFCASDYYKGKTMEIIVSAGGPGSGTDIAGRVIAKNMGKFIPGNPAIIVRNMTAGGGTAGSNHVYAVAKKDGLTVLFGGGKNAMGSLLRVVGARYDYAKMIPTMTMPFGAVAYAKSSIAKKPEEIIKSNDLMYGGSSLPSMTTVFMFLSYEVLRYRAQKNIVAYPGPSDARLAFMRGEVNISSETAAGYNESVKPLVDSREAVPLWQSGLLSEKGEIVKEPAVPADILTVQELHRKIHGSDPSGPAWDAFKMVVGVVANNSKTILFPPGTEAQAAIVSLACQKMVKDPEFLADMNKIAPGNPAYVGAELKSLWKASMALARPEAIDWLRNLMASKYAMDFEK